MSPGGHLVVTAAQAIGAYALTGSAGVVAGVVAGGFLIDGDHAVDYVLFETQRDDLSPGAFLRYYANGRYQRVVLLLHSYELLAVLAMLAWLTHAPWLWGYVAGMALHLVLDIVFNARPVTGGIVRFYSFAVRARGDFDAARFFPVPLPHSNRAFWAAFFRENMCRG